VVVLPLSVLSIGGMVWLRSEAAKAAANLQSPGAPEPSLAAPCVPAAASAATRGAPDDLDSPCDDDRAAIWDELTPPPPLPSPSSSQPSSPVLSAADSSRSPSGLHVSTSGAPSSPAAPEAPAKSLGELIREILEGTSEAESDSDSDSGSAAVEASAEVHTGLTDDSDDEDIPDHPQRRRLRRGDEVSDWHPPLPEPPTRHPSNNRLNHYDPSTPWDYTAEADISRLLDVSGDPPHRCFLVQ
jgi:hypothetical protein